MRKTKTIDLGEGRKFTLQELTVGEILSIFGSGDEKKETGVGDIFALAEKHCGLTAETLQTLTPSEVQTIYDGFLEVNAAFFDVAGKVGLQKLVAPLQKLIEKAIDDYCCEIYALLSNGGTEHANC
ncbi:lariat debranching enzyme B [Candidatus Magnetoovum chiemensis]|nr:lariat debranching enzyme B [Candidatus Magnetoovum chiemensis]